MTSLDTNTSGLLGHYLDLAAFRHRLIANNVANIDTPGFKAQDIDFGAELKHALTAGGSPEPKVNNVDGLIERPDGNNVSLDRESMLMAQTQLQFRVGVQLLRTEYHRLLLAINEGRQG